MTTGRHNRAPSKYGQSDKTPSHHSNDKKEEHGSSGKVPGGNFPKLTIRHTGQTVQKQVPPPSKPAIVIDVHKLKHHKERKADSDRERDRPRHVAKKSPSSLRRSKYNVKQGPSQALVTPQASPCLPMNKGQRSPSAYERNSKSLYTPRASKGPTRRNPSFYKQIVQMASSPSQLSLKSITEYYNIPDKSFRSAEEVFKSRGYKKTGKIDEGAFGIVSKAIRLSDKAVVAVKEVDLRKKRSKRIEEMRRELFVLQKVDSEHVVKLIEHFIIGQMLVIVMEFCAGSNLTSFLKMSPIEEDEARSLFKQMSAAVQVLHKRGIAHRDVKLNNFLLDASRKVIKIADFGLSVVSYRRSSGILMAKTYCGTEPYMAPELLRRNSLGFRSYNPLYADVWSLGVCLFAMLTRSFPFKMHSSHGELFRAQTSRRWRFPRQIRETLSEEIKDLIWHMLDPEPERRITINGVMAHPWQNQGQVYQLSIDETDSDVLKNDLVQSALPVDAPKSRTGT